MFTMDTQSGFLPEWFRIVITLGLSFAAVLGVINAFVVHQLNRSAHDSMHGYRRASESLETPAGSVGRNAWFPIFYGASMLALGFKLMPLAIYDMTALFLCTEVILSRKQWFRGWAIAVRAAGMKQQPDS
jgi:hypothetical protein